jgi:hypothetical protein
MSKKVIAAEIEVKTANSIADLKALKKQLKDTAAGSDEFKKLYNQIDDLEDKIKGSKKASSDWIDTLESAGGPLGAIGGALNKAKVATQSFGGALKATGIGLFVAAIGGLVAAFSQTDGSLKKLQPLLIGMEKIFGGLVKIAEPLIDALLDFGLKALPYVTDAIGSAYSVLSSFLGGLGKLGAAIGKLIKGDFVGAWDEAKKSVTEFGTRYEDANTRFIAGTKEVTKTEKEELDKRAAARAAAAALRLEAEKKENEALQKEYEEALKRKEFAKKNSENLTRQEIVKNEQLDKDDKQKASNEEIDRNLVTQNKVLSTYSNSLYSKLAIEKTAKDASAKLTEEDRIMKVNAALDIADASLALGAIVGEQTAAGKALGIASALINTYVGASEVIRAKSVLPEPFGTIQKIASVAAIIATGLKTVKTITSVKVPGASGSGGVSIPSASSISAPLQAQVSSTMLNQNQVNQIGNVAARAFVVESDVSGNQERIQRLNRAARIN